MLFLFIVEFSCDSLINDIPSVFEVVTDRKLVKDKPSADSGSKSRGSAKVSVFLF